MKFSGRIRIVIMETYLEARKLDIERAKKIFQITETITEDELKRRYRKLAIKYHPDRYKDDGEAFLELKEAYELIQNNLANLLTITHESLFNFNVK